VSGMSYEDFMAKRLFAPLARPARIAGQVA
jgi:hypothetical protein